MERRRFLKGAAAIACLPLERAAPWRAITHGPAYHWGGYYDKLLTDPSDRYVLAHAVSFAGRTPRLDDEVRVGMIDLEDGDRWIELGMSTAWSWQQGAMLQWVPGSDRLVLWNDRPGARILDVTTGEARTLPRHVSALSPDERTAFCCDFGRIHVTRPGYGYAVPPRDGGLWRIDTSTGSCELVHSLAGVARLEREPDMPALAQHWIYQPLVSPSSGRVAFLHCWHPSPRARARARLITSDHDGGRPYVLVRWRASHFVWHPDGKRILVWSAGRFQLLTDRTNESVDVGRSTMTEDGHCTFVDASTILCDTYPDELTGEQRPYLFDGRRRELGRFPAPVHRGSNRCDLHPRASRGGRFVVIDSAHAGGRQMYMRQL